MSEPKRLDEYKKRIASLQKPTEHVLQEGDMLGLGEVKIGPGDNNITMSRGAIEVNNEDPGLRSHLSSGGSEVKFGNNVRLDTPLGKFMYENNRALNPQLRHRPPNVVSYYPVVITLPPGIVSNLLRGVLGGIIGFVKAVSEAKNAD